MTAKTRTASDVQTFLRRFTTLAIQLVKAKVLSH